MKKLYLLFVLFALYPQLGYTQSQNNFWYFGSNAGVHFANGSSTTTPTPVFDATSFFSTAVSVVSCSQWSGNNYLDVGGCATVSKSDGSLLFYTNGQYIFNNLHQPMAVSSPGIQPLYEYTSLVSKQAAVIIPNPANSNQYYVISSCAPKVTSTPAFQWGYFLAVVDFSGNPNGQIISSRQAFAPYCEGSQALTVTKDFSGNGFWVLIPKGLDFPCPAPVDELLAFRVDNTGISMTPTVVTNLGYNIYHSSEIKVSSKQANAKVAISGSNGAYNFSPPNPLPKLRVYSFDRQTGQIGNNFLLNVDNMRVFSTEFSENQDLLYAIIQTTNGNRLVVFDINSPSTPYRVLANTEVFGSLQRAVDGQIYFTNKSNVLYKIDNQNSFSLSSISTTTVNVNRCTLFGLPQLVPTFGWPEEACQSLTLNVETHTTAPFVYQNYSDITAQTNYVVNGTMNITMHAEDFIVLKPNTHIFTKDGGLFWAKPQNCSSSEEEPEEGGGKEKTSDELFETAIKLFPNPSNSMVTIASDIVLERITIISVDGKEVFTKNIGDTATFDLDVSNFSDGIYIVTVQVKDGKTFVEKLVKN